MTPPTFRPRGRVLAVAALLALLAGGAIALASTGGGTDPAPPAATNDVPGLVSIGRPITPTRTGAQSNWQIELRVANPDRGGPKVLLFDQRTKRINGRVRTQRCFTFGPERQMRRGSLRTVGDCTDERNTEPWNFTMGASSEGPSLVIVGLANPDVKRLAVAGPGGTFVVPRSAHGGFALIYGRHATGRATLTATLHDGSTRYLRFNVPPSFFAHEGAVVVRDPGGLPSWQATAARRDRGVRRGQTCVNVIEDVDLRARGLRSGGQLLAPICGELHRDPVVARVVDLHPRPLPGPFNRGRLTPRRTILAGAVGEQVASVAVVSPQGRRELALSDAGRAFLAVFPSSVGVSDLNLEVTLSDGPVLRFPAPRSVNGATLENPAPRVLGKPRLQLTAPREVTLEAHLSDRTRRFEITFLGREVAMHRVSGTTYRGRYDGTRGVQRRLVAGRIYTMTVITCGDECSTTLMRARLRN